MIDELDQLIADFKDKNGRLPRTIYIGQGQAETLTHFNASRGNCGCPHSYRDIQLSQSTSFRRV